MGRICGSPLFKIAISYTPKNLLKPPTYKTAWDGWLNYWYFWGMKRILSILFLVSVFTFSALAGDGDKIPAVTVKKLDGSKVSSSTFTNAGKPIIISFWATWCKPCKKELDAIQESYSDWTAETGVKLIAVSIDDVR